MANDAPTPEKPEAIEAKKKLELLENILGNEATEQNEASGIISLFTAISSTISSIEQTRLVQYENDKVDNKPRRAGVIPRLYFDFLKITFFVDFTVAAKTSGDEPTLEGRVVYGSCRSTTTEEPFDKPLFECPLSHHGLIKDPGGIKGQWMIEPNDAKKFTDTHYLIMDCIWADALAWSNEYPSE